jgi:uncharacterized protein YkwD
MRRVLFPLILSSITLLFAACSTLPKALPSDPELAEVLTLVNQARAQGADCGGDIRPPAAPLANHAVLERVADNHSEDMMAAGVMSHDTPVGAIHYPPGTTFDARIRAEGYSYALAGENIAWGFSDAASVVNAWLNSPGHCRNLMNSGFSDIGLGREGTYWAQEFAHPQGEVGGSSSAAR